MCILAGKRRKAIFMLLVGMMLYGSLPGIGQSVQRPGFIVDHAGDTTEGWFRYRAWGKNPRFIEFSSDSNGRRFQRVGVDDIRYFEVDGYDAYVRAEVVRDMRPIKHEDAWGEEVDSLLDDIVFLRVLALGDHLNLYELIGDKPHYYISNDNLPLTELTYRLSQSAISNTYVWDFGYRQQLLSLVPPGTDQQELARMIQKVGYGEGLKKIVERINGDSRRDLTRRPLIQDFYHRWYASASGGGAQLASHGESADFTALSSNRGWAFSLAFGRTMYMSRKLAKTTLQTELAFSTADFEKNGQRQDDPGLALRYRMTQHNISPTVLVCWYPIRTDHLRIYLGGGAAFNFSLYGVNQIALNYQEQGWVTVDDYLSVRRFWSSGVFRLGAWINDKWEVSLQHQRFGNTIAEPDLALMPLTYQLRFAWGF